MIKYLYDIPKIPKIQVAELKATQKEDVEHNDFCDKEFNESDVNLDDTAHEKKTLETNIAALDSAILELSNGIAQSQKELAETQVAIKKAGEDREAENHEFQVTVQDQRATQEILGKALDKLNAFYKKKSFLQAKTHQTPPMAFAPQRSNSGASPVLAMIEKIVEDSKATEKEAIADESEAQANYETFVADANAAIGKLKKGISQKQDESANKDAEKQQRSADLTAASEEFDQLTAYRQDLHGQCDFIVKHFDARKQARTTEIEAIAEAKGILAGAQ